MIQTQRLFSNMFFRTMFTDLFGRSAYTKAPGGFEPYFQYKVEKYRQQDYLLYFPKEPFPLLYKNEVFNKLCEYSGSDIADFLDFHYSAYSDKRNFLRFLNFEIAERMSRKPNSDRRLKLKSTLQWVAEKQGQLNQLNFREEACQPVEELNITNLNVSNPLPQTLVGRITEFFKDFEERMESLLSSLLAGRIHLNNHAHLVKLIQLFYLIQNIQSPGRAAKGELLFKKFTNNDLASMLRMHIEGFTDKKLNTVEKNIREARDLLRWDDPKVQKLEVALQDFFY